MSRCGILMAMVIALAPLAGIGPAAAAAPEERLAIFSLDQPYPTEKYLRIGYTLKTWEYEKEGLELLQIAVLDRETGAPLLVLDQKNLPRIYKEPLPPNPYYPNDQLTHYYLSLQLPLPLEAAVPRTVLHRFQLRDTRTGRELAVEGAPFDPPQASTPLAIASPVRGRNWLFVNQSTQGYHFNALFFVPGRWGSGERFAFDNVQLDDTFTDYFAGDPRKNASYFNYKAPLYAVADGRVVAVRDGLPENDGNAHNVTFKEAIDLAGNYVILEIGPGRYAFYAHCHPHSIRVKVGDRVREGDQIALLGNSGNSDAPHLHFQIGDRPDFFFSRGLPFVLKRYRKIAEVGGQAPVRFDQSYVNAMMEEATVIGFD